MKATEIPEVWWDIIRPPPCECGQSFDRDITEIVAAVGGGFAIKCPSCNQVKRLRLVLE